MSFQFTIDHDLTDALLEESAVSWGRGVEAILFRFFVRRTVARFCTPSVQPPRCEVSVGFLCSFSEFMDSYQLRWADCACWVAYLILHHM